jgi:hypothetical protein
VARRIWPRAEDLAFQVPASIRLLFLEDVMGERNRESLLDERGRLFPLGGRDEVGSAKLVVGTPAPQFDSSFVARLKSSSVVNVLRVCTCAVLTNQMPTKPNANAVAAAYLSPCDNELFIMTSRAVDERLNCDVALEMIRRDATDDHARARMWREARAAARINHPNVCQIYEIGEADGELFLTMELLEGEPLSAKLARGPLACAEAVQLILAILTPLEVLHPLSASNSGGPLPSAGIDMNRRPSCRPAA